VQGEVFQSKVKKKWKKWKKFLTGNFGRGTLTGYMVKVKAQAKTALLRELQLAAGDMVQGALSEVRRRCGDESCACFSDPVRRHGPHIYLTYRSEGKSWSVYIPAEEGAAVKEAHAAWVRFTEAASEISAINRERLLKGVAERKKKKGEVGKEKQRRRRGGK
jgi:class 3 adenylate cyclase